MVKVNFRYDGYDLMRVYWSLKSVPELAALTRKERRRVHEECLRRYFLHGPASCRSITAFLAHIFICACCLVVSISIFGGFGMKPNFWVFLASAFICAPVGMFVFSRVAIPYLRPFYREFIEKKGLR
jgi:hypothetical protein